MQMREAINGRGARVERAESPTMLLLLLSSSLYQKPFKVFLHMMVLFCLLFSLAHGFDPKNVHK